MYRQIHEEQRADWIEILGGKPEVDAARNAGDAVKKQFIGSEFWARVYRHPYYG